MSDKLRIALIGCGNIARAHWRGIRYHAPRLEVAAVVDEDLLRAQAFAERTGATPFGSLAEALAAGGFEAVDIMLPHDLHEAAATAAFAAGKHVVLEKPMAPDLPSCERILDAARRAGTVFMVAEQAQYWPDIIEARRLIDAGRIGTVLGARACFYDPLPDMPAGAKPWRFELARAGGGIAIDGCAHWIRPLRMLLGEVEETIAVTRRHIDGMEGESLVQALLRFRSPQRGSARGYPSQEKSPQRGSARGYPSHGSGVVASFDSLLHAGPVAATEDFRVTGTAGELVIEHGPEGRLLLVDADHPQGEKLMDAFPGKVDSYGVELHDFSLAVLDGRPLAATPEFSLGELRTALAMYRSASSGRWEKVWD